MAGPLFLNDVDWLLHDIHGTKEWLAFLSIPLFTGVVGWLINYTGLWMLFSPVHFHGWIVPGLKDVAKSLPRKVQEIPGLLVGGIGWQGIVPARAAKMGSIAVDKAIAKIGTPRDFYYQLEPERIRDHIVEVFRPEVPSLVDDVMRRSHPAFWRDMPEIGKRTIVARVEQSLPSVVGTVTDQIGEHIDLLLDPKIMVIDHFEQHPDLVVRVFKEVGQRELDMLVHFGFIFGFLFGIPVAFAQHWFHQWWLLPALGVVVGWMTNKLGMSLIFSPPEPRRFLGVTFHGLFVRRQQAAAEVYARIISEDVITLEHIGNFLLNGPRGDRTRQMLADALAPAIDKAAGPVRGAARIAMGRQAYDAIRTTFAEEAVDRTLIPLQDVEFSRQQAENIRRLVAERTKQLSGAEFVEMMRSAFREDEWLLYAHGAIMGFAGGLLHIAVFGVGGR